MLHAHTARFDVTGTVALFGKTFRKLNKGIIRDLQLYQITVLAPFSPGYTELTTLTMSTCLDCLFESCMHVWRRRRWHVSAFHRWTRPCAGQAPTTSPLPVPTVSLHPLTKTLSDTYSYLASTYS